MAIKREGERKVIRNKFIKIRVTPAEQERFRQLASERGITLSKLVTDLLEEQHK
jgi:predicted DNA binding CopG/RHH family protein